VRALPMWMRPVGDGANRTVGEVVLVPLLMTGRESRW
jgi:hypothetical protein